jgi:hypothetical protein
MILFISSVYLLNYFTQVWTIIIFNPSYWSSITYFIVFYIVLALIIFIYFFILYFSNIFRNFTAGCIKRFICFEKDSPDFSYKVLCCIKLSNKSNVDNFEFNFLNFWKSIFKKVLNNWKIHNNI